MHIVLNMSTVVLVPETSSIRIQPFRQASRDSPLNATARRRNSDCPRRGLLVLRLLRCMAPRYTTAAPDGLAPSELKVRS
jgi:hypothetical protein